ncbi:hypothetical protein Hypma_003378 [Hypsizygus marmoreus]|uniref:Uncharacterized protein n=1 Tax=Hypsizygus marmoreus TaxID=39966 RepID=A0A369J291_HYPMA|nr:hypothetical protein Hypma_003378 [Hypsizygus marmoreus]
MLLRVFSCHLPEEHVRVLAFILTISSPTSGGSFHLFDTESAHLHEIGKLGASKNTAHCHLQDFMITDDSLFALSDRQGQSFVEKAVINVEYVDDSHAPVWHAHLMQ